MKHYQIKEEQGFKYFEEGEGEVLLLLHGLFGALSNFHGVIDHFSQRMKVCLPQLPLYELPTDETSVIGMVDYVKRFIEHKGYGKVHLLGNSLGGHIALIYALENLDKVESVVLTASSGLFESSLGDTYPKKSDYNYIKEKTEQTFYDPEMASKELVDEIFEIVNNREKAIRILYLAKSALRHNLKERVSNIIVPVSLIWGKDDTITPAFVGEEFDKLLPDSELHIIEKCGHAPMMERPEEFNRILDEFLTKIRATL